MTHITCRLSAKNRDQLRNPTLWAIFFTIPPNPNFWTQPNSSQPNLWMDPTHFVPKTSIPYEPRTAIRTDAIYTAFRGEFVSSSRCLQNPLSASDSTPVPSFSASVAPPSDTTTPMRFLVHSPATTTAETRCELLTRPDPTRPSTTNNAAYID